MLGKNQNQNKTEEKKRRDIESAKENVQIDKISPITRGSLDYLSPKLVREKKVLGSISPHLILHLLFEKFLKLKDSARGKKKSKGGEITKTQPLTN